MRHSVKSAVYVARDTGFVCLPLPSCLASGLVSVTHFLPEASPTDALLPTRAGQVDAPEQGGHHRQERVRQGGGAVGGRRQARQEVRVAHGGHQGGQRLRAPSRQAEKVRQLPPQMLGLARMVWWAQSVRQLKAESVDVVLYRKHNSQCESTKSSSLESHRAE